MHMLPDSLSGSIVWMLTMLIIIEIVHSSALAEAKGPVTSTTAPYSVDFAGYNGGSVDQWLKTQNYVFEGDAKKRAFLGLSITGSILTLEAKVKIAPDPWRPVSIFTW